MAQPPPFVSVIIAAPPNMVEVRAVAAAKKMDYPAGRMEIILARGKQPSVQRNTALRAAVGNWVYFLDDDSLAQPDSLRRAEKYFSDPAVKMVGGPSICPPDAPPLEQVFAVVMASWLAFGPSRARYAKIGVARASSEKELILCNQLARREDVLALGGFNEALYPNEENALMDELQKRGGKLIYDPDVFIYRRPRRTLKAFFKMLRTYGRGRAEQFRLHPTLGSAPNFVPPLFCVYLVLLALFLAWTLGSELARLRPFAAAPLALYMLAVLGQTIISMRSHGLVRSVLAAPLLVASHLFYGFGFWHGLFTKLKTGAQKTPVEVTLEKISPGAG